MADKREWRVQMIVRGSDAELDAIADRIGDVICQPSDHDGQCATPWALTRCLIDDLDEPERSAARSQLDGE